jgi:hypothetical protein
MKTIVAGFCVGFGAVMFIASVVVVFYAGWRMITVAEEEETEHRMVRSLIFQQNMEKLKKASRP